MADSYEHPVIGDLSSMKERKNNVQEYYRKQKNRDQFFRYYETLKKRLKGYGWESFTPGSQCELWVRNGTSRNVSYLLVDPWMLEGVFRVRLKLFDEKYIHILEEKIREKTRDIPRINTVKIEVTRQKKKKEVVEKVVDVRISRELLFENANTVEAVEKS